MQHRARPVIYQSCSVLELQQDLTTHSLNYGIAYCIVDCVIATHQ